jgi:hypothetical protein
MGAACAFFRTDPDRRTKTVDLGVWGERNFQAAVLPDSLLVGWCLTGNFGVGDHPPRTRHKCYALFSPVDVPNCRRFARGWRASRKRINLTWNFDTVLPILHRISGGLFASYSVRSAVTGSIRMARHAGKRRADNTTKSSRVRTEKNVSGSVGFTPNSKPLMMRVSPSAPISHFAVHHGRLWHSDAIPRPGSGASKLLLLSH